MAGSWWWWGKVWGVHGLQSRENGITGAMPGRSFPCLQLPVAGPVELGATWFHGTIKNPVFDFAVKQGIISAGGAGGGDGGSCRRRFPSWQQQSGTFLRGSLH